MSPGTCGSGCVRTRRRIFSDTRQQLNASAGLQQVIVGTYFQPDDAVDRFAARGQHQYGQPGKRRCRAQRCGTASGHPRRAASGPRRQSRSARFPGSAHLFSLGGKADAFFADNRRPVGGFRDRRRQRECTRCCSMKPLSPLAPALSPAGVMRFVSLYVSRMAHATCRYQPRGCTQPGYTAAFQWSSWNQPTQHGLNSEESCHGNRKRILVAALAVAALARRYGPTR